MKPAAAVIELQRPASAPGMPASIVRNFFATIAILVSCLLHPTSGQVADGSSRLDEIVQSALANRQFMGAVLVVKDGRSLLDKAYGFADMGQRRPNSVNTRFPVASLSKQFTAAGILLLEERGKLRTDDAIVKYIPNVPPAWRKITIRHLLTHTSGIPGSAPLPGLVGAKPFAASPTGPNDPAIDGSLEFAPGSRFSYSNAGYRVLDHLIEKLSGQSYAEFLQTNIFDPLAMKETGFGGDCKAGMKGASGYAPLWPESGKSVSAPAAWDLCSTTHDLLLWEQGLFGGQMLSQTSLDKMTTPSSAGYGFGLWITRLDKQTTVIYHPGNISGFSSAMAYVPDSKLYVVVLSNIDGTAAPRVQSQLLDVARGID